MTIEQLFLSASFVANSTNIIKPVSSLRSLRNKSNVGPSKRCVNREVKTNVLVKMCYVHETNEQSVKT